MPYRYLLLLSLLTLLALPSLSQPRAVTTRDHSVLVSAKAEKSPAPKITLSWKANELATGYSIRRKLASNPLFPNNIIAQIAAPNTSWTDTQVETGVLYEYEVSARSTGTIYRYIDANYNEKDSAVVRDFLGFGYICAGIEVPERHTNGKVLMLVDETISSPLEPELKRLREDLVTEGWAVVQRTVPRAETFNSDNVRFVKDIIAEVYGDNDQGLTTIFLIGRVPVPYSGQMRPDGHTEHIGAWPADLYYGYMDEFFWTDTGVDDTSSAWKNHWNKPFDGKFDQSNFINGRVDLAVGRVDFYNMTYWVNDSTFSELEMYKKYLDKDHKYRTGEMSYVKRGLVEDNFGASGYIEGFASCGWRNIGSLVGGDSTSWQDWLATLRNASYLWAYGCGGGGSDHQSCGNIVTSTELSQGSLNAVFTILFGSYFGDWDMPNGLLRAPLCTEPSALTCFWGGRPQWLLHHMAMNYPIGYSTLLSQNNSGVYMSNYLYLPPAYPNGVAYMLSNKAVHASLMGDPTLTMFSASVPPPQNLAVLMPSQNEIKITWDHPTADKNFRYDIYKSMSELGPFKLVNSTKENELEFTDTEVLKGEVYYMVRAVALEESNTGSFFNLSRGVIKSVVTVGVEDSKENVLYIECTPNPVSSEATLSINMPQAANASIEIADLNGNKVKDLYTGRLAAGLHRLSWNTADNMLRKVSPGIYIVRMKTDKSSKTLKIVVIP